MADIPPADDWWLASDGKYYPPETHPDYVAAPPAPRMPPPPAPPTASPSSWEAPAGPPTFSSPPPQPIAPPAAATEPAGGGASGSGSSTLLRFWWVPLLVGLVGLGVVLATSLGGGDDDSVAAGVRQTPAGEDQPTVSSDPTAAAVTTPTPDPEATSTPQPPTPAPGDRVDRTPDGFAAEVDPAGFGQLFGGSDWRISVVDAFDADEEGLVSEFDDPLPDGMVNLAILYEITYVGPDLTGWDPVRMTALGSERYDAFLGCYLDFDALESVGVDSRAYYELVPGQTQRLAECARVPRAELDDIVIEIEYDYSRDPIYFRPDGSALPPLNPSGIEPGPPDVPTLGFGDVVEWDQWSGTIVELLDAEAEGLVNQFADDPAPGNAFVAVVYEVTNVDSDDEFDPVSVTALGRKAYGPFSGCFLDDDAMLDIGLDDPFDDVAPGSTKRTALCFEVPAADVDSLVYRLESFSDFDDRPGLYSVG